jgi:hypothetical protein
LEKLKNYSESPSSVVERDALRKMVRLRWGLALMDLNLVDDLLRRKNPRPLSKKKKQKWLLLLYFSRPFQWGCWKS